MTTTPTPAIPTAEEILKSVLIDGNNAFDVNDDKFISTDVLRAMRLFARLHLEALAKEVKEKLIATYLGELAKVNTEQIEQILGDYISKMK